MFVLAARDDRDLGAVAAPDSVPVATVDNLAPELAAGAGARSPVVAKSGADVG